LIDDGRQGELAGSVCNDHDGRQGESAGSVCNVVDDDLNADEDNSNYQLIPVFNFRFNPLKNAENSPKFNPFQHYPIIIAHLYRGASVSVE